MLVEAARIARGDILPLTQARAETLDALIVPGGFGAAKNLSSFAAEGSECQVDRDLQALALAMHQAGKPLGFMCIAPAMLPKIFAFPLRMTIGTDLDTADVVEEMGAEHVLARSTTSWWMKRTRWSPPRRICWQRTLRKPPAELRSWWPACWR
jgi:enhancing lycopene biosynthesis protein 2